MGEVAASIESRVTYEDQRAALSDKISKGEIGFYLQDKVSMQDFKAFVANGPSQKLDGDRHKKEFMEDEMFKLKQKVDETFH